MKHAAPRSRRRCMQLPALGLLLLAACATARPAPSPPASSPPTPAAAERAAAERLLLRRAELELVAEEPDTLAAHVAAIAGAAGGHVASSLTAEGRVLRMSLRVPSAALDATLARLSALGRVERRQVHAVDVTEQVLDLDARLANLRAVRDRLRGHLERSAAMSDVIQVERELARVQGEIELLEGRSRRLREDVALAQLDLVARRERVLGPLGQLVAGTAWLIGKLFVIR